VEQIAPLVGINSIEDGLGIVDKEGTKTLLLFEALPELPEATDGPSLSNLPVSLRIIVGFIGLH